MEPTTKSRGMVFLLDSVYKQLLLLVLIVVVDGHRLTNVQVGDVGLPLVQSGGVDGSGAASIFRDVSGEQCPEITLRETSVMLREAMLPGIGLPLFQIKTQCGLVDGQVFDPVYTPILQNYNRVVFGGYRFIRLYPDAVVGTLQCGQVLTCELSVVSSIPGREFELARLTSGKCTYDYRNFIQWGYEQKGLGFTCSEGSAYYTLTCDECQQDDFPWELAYNLSGPILDEESSSSASFNYIMVITAVSVVGFAILASFVAILVRTRRRSAIDLRVAEMVSRSTREPEKPPELFIVSENDDQGCLPSSEYDGPIVVFNASKLELDGESRDSLDPHESFSTELRGAPSTQWSLSQIAVVDVIHDNEEEEEHDATQHDTDEREQPQGGSSTSTSDANGQCSPSEHSGDEAPAETRSTIH